MRNALLLGLGSTLIALGFSLLPAGRAIEEELGLPWLFQLRGAVPPPPEAVIVGINSDTGRALGLPRLPRDWPRALHGKITDLLVERGAGVIVFDFDFSSARAPEDDVAFAEAIDRSNRVVVQEALEAKKITTRSRDGREQTIWFEERRPPSPPIALSSRAIAPFPLPKLGQSVFQFWTFKASLGDAPTTAAVALQLWGEPWHDEWVDLLAAAGAPNTERLRIVKATEVPDRQPWLHVDPTRTPTQLRALMERTRALFVNDPGLAERARRELATRQAAAAVTTAKDRYFAALLSLYGGSDQRYLNFYGPPGTLPTVPYHRLAVGECVTEYGDPIDVAGKVVFVGYSDLHDPAQPDRFYTVFTNDDGVDLSGVEIMASAFGNLLRDETIRVAPFAETAVVLAGFGMTTAIIAALLPALAGLPLVVLLAGGYVVGAEWLFAGEHLWLPLAVPVLVQLPIAMLGGIFLQYLVKRQSERRVTAAISHYLPDNIYRELVAKNFDPQGLNRLVRGIILASDMSGFTTISEHKRPEELAAFMNAYFAAMGRILKRHAIDFIEFHADSIMCAWTDRNAAFPRAAIDAAIDLAEGIVAFSEQTEVPLRPRIGIKDGEFFLGHTGGEARLSFSLVGDTVNTAARLETLNKHLGTAILASATAVAVADAIVMRELGHFQVLGRSEAIAVVEILGRRLGGNDPRAELCTDFATALAAFQAGDWPIARRRFAAILRRWPADGPTRFYLGKCDEYESYPLNTVPDAIHMLEK